MVASTITVQFVDTSSNTGNNLWVIGEAAAGVVITGIDVIGSYGFDSVSGVGVPPNFQAYVVHGIQRGAHGYTPSGVVSHADDPTWLFNGLVRPSNVGIVSPDTPAGNNAITDRYEFELYWRGQLPITALTDFYYSEGSILGSSVVKWRLSAVARMYFDNL